MIRKLAAALLVLGALVMCIVAAVNVQQPISFTAEIPNDGITDIIPYDPDEPALYEIECFALTGEPVSEAVVLWERSLFPQATEHDLYPGLTNSEMLRYSLGSDDGLWTEARPDNPDARHELILEVQRNMAYYCDVLRDNRRTESALQFGFGLLLAATAATLATLNFTPRPRRPRDVEAC